MHELFKRVSRLPVIFGAKISASGKMHAIKMQATMALFKRPKTMPKKPSTIPVRDFLSPLVISAIISHIKILRTIKHMANTATVKSKFTVIWVMLFSTICGTELKVTSDGISLS